MKVLLRLLFITILAAGAGCAGNSQKDELYQAYVDCQNENKVPKVDEKGIVSLDSESNPIMTYSKDACSAENDAYNVAAQKADRNLNRREAGPSCPGDLILFCQGKCSARDMERERCRCSCQTRGAVSDFMRGFGNRRY